jgi:hypothetical protein
MSQSSFPLFTEVRRRGVLGGSACEVSSLYAPATTDANNVPNV